MADAEKPKDEFYEYAVARDQQLLMQRGRQGCRQNELMQHSPLAREAFYTAKGYTVTSYRF